MKLRISRNVLVEGLQKVQSIVSTRTTLPILSNVLLRAEQGKLALCTTDLEVGVRTAVDAKVTEPGGTTLPARRLFSIVKELPADELDLEVDEKNHATIKSGSSYFKIIGLSEEEFPPLPKFSGGRSYSMDQGVFKLMLQSTGYAASSDETRYVLNGVLLSFKGDKLTLVATDGRRLALMEQELEFPKEAEADLILPSKAVAELIRTLGDEGPLKIQASENQIAFEFVSGAAGSASRDELLLVSKLIDGVYPNFRQVIPSSSEERVTVERELLLNAVRRVALVTNDKSNSVKITLGKNRLDVTANTPEFGEARETMAIKYTGKDITISFNPEFVLDPLRHLTADEVYLELNDELSPGHIKSRLPFLYVLMPMRMS